MAATLRLEDIRRAWDCKDPELAGYIAQLADQADTPPEQPIREGAPTWDDFLRTIKSPSFPWRYRTEEEQRHYRVEQIKALEAPNAEVPLPDRLKLHEVLMMLWKDESLFARTVLLKIIATVPLRYGPWRAIKKIFKEAEERSDTEVFGALAARFDMAYSSHGRTEVSGATLAYLVRRAWRYLRRLGTSLPAVYADTCVDVLSKYTEGFYPRNTWILNHIFYHETKRYNRSRFTLYGAKLDLLKNRAFGELWQRSPRPLFSLLERAQCDEVRDFATTALKADFRAQLREVEPSWVARLVHIGSRSIDEFVVWILKNVPRFEQSAFRTLGLHEAVLRLFDSPSTDAQAYAAEYARTHARDLPVEELVRLVNNSHDAVRKLAVDLLLTHDPRKEVGLETWGQLLETQYGYDLAATNIKKHFGAAELTQEWFKQRLFTQHQKAFDFIKKLLLEIHPRDKLGAAFFGDLIDRVEDYNRSRRVLQFATDELAKFDLNTLDVDFLKRITVHPHTWNFTINAINQGKLKPQTLGAPFLKMIAFHPQWETDPWVTELKERRPWARDLLFNENLSQQALNLLGDVRKFTPAEIGFDWLMQLVARSEERYHDFAVELMIKVFKPADFAPKAAATPAPPPTQTLPPSGGGQGGGAAPTVNLGGKTFLFTGKMASMKREDAEAQVTAAGGVVLSNVSPKLAYLVIGDEGSPLYGQGSKGSKQTKAEDLNAKGSNIAIISETDFLQMIAGAAPAPVSGDATLAGSQKLWEMATAPGPADARVAQFAIKYLRWHDPDLRTRETDRPQAKDAEIPPSFLNYERVSPLFFESRKPLRDFALDLAHFRFAAWKPPIQELIKLSEAPFNETRRFVTNALLAEDSPPNRGFRIDPEVLTPQAVYSFCESADESTRALGMELIKRSPRLQLPEELFRLTESPDRKVRGFVIRNLWSLYRDRGITPDWKPVLPPQPKVGATTRKAWEEAVAILGSGAPHKPEQLPADRIGLEAFLRRVLFEVPPVKPPPARAEEGQEITVKLKPIPARRAKLSLVDTLRDLALEDAELAKGLLPLFEEFMRSRGVSEKAACLVAVTRIKHAHAAKNAQTALAERNGEPAT